MNILLISGSDTERFVNILKKALTEKDTLEVRISNDIDLEEERDKHYDVVIMNESNNVNLLPLFKESSIHGLDWKVLVVNDEPTWDHARDFFWGGALDYRRLPLNSQELREIIKTINSLTI